MRQPIQRVLATAAAFGAVLISPAAAQYRVGPIYPEQPAPQVVQQAGYDPFVLDPYTGRFRYVPIPYEPQTPGAGYSPYRFNWYSGRWDYVPVPLAQDYEAMEAQGLREAMEDYGGTASNYIETRLGTAPSALTLRPSPAAIEPPSTMPPPPPPHRRRAALPPAPARPGAAVQHRPVPATRPAATRPTTAPIPQPPVEGEPVGDGWVKVKGIVGRWEYDYNTGRWVFVLPRE